MKSKLVEAYLQYLQSVSRRIIQRGGFHAIPLKNKPCLLGDSERLEAYLKQVKEVIKKGEQNLFFGFALVGGKFASARGGRSTKTRITAPVLIASAEIVDSETENGIALSVSVEPVWESLILNVDLLTNFLTGRADFAPEEDDDLPGEGIPQFVLDRLAELARKVECDADTDAAQRALLNGESYAADVVREMLSILPQAPKIGFEDSPLSTAAFTSNVNADGLRCWADAFLFLAPVPSQLSTTVALQRLRKEYAEGKLRSDLLDDLLTATLQKHAFRNAHSGPSADEIEAAIDAVPMSLSARQRVAIHNAWSKRISYVQGPPGTGKSHTITAMMLSALALGQRVLMVSHKPAAIAIVRDKVDQLLKGADQETVIVEASPLPQNRQRVQRFIRDVVAKFGSINARSRVSELRREVEKAKREVDRKSADLDRTTRAVCDELEREREFLDLCERLRSERSIFCKAFSVTEELLKGPHYAPTSIKWRRSMERAHSITFSGEGRINRLNLLYLKRFFKSAVSRIGADRQKLRPGAAAMEYLTRYDELLRCAQDVSSKQRSMNAAELRALRGQLKVLEDELLAARRRLIMTSYHLHLAESLESEGASDDLNGYASTFRFKNPRILSERLQNIDFSKVTRALPLWVGEMRHLGNFLPSQSDLFDLIIVDEASQVNIAEIVPAISRGNRLCVVGDTKQLGLDSVGLFALNQTFETLCWTDAFSELGVTLQDAEARCLRVSRHSILDLITSPAREFNNIPRVMLNEHFRSVPGLAAFTSSQFYKQDDGELLLMRETAGNVQKNCFAFIEVPEGKREGKTVPKEAEAVFDLLKRLMEGEHPLKHLNSGPPSIGILCFLTEQRNYIRHHLEDKFDSAILQRHRVLVGTTEEFQGNERSIMILTMAMDAETRYAKGFFENPKRFNVATSRATDFTYFITSAVPENASVLQAYLRHFGATWTRLHLTPGDAPIGEAPSGCSNYWNYDAAARESEFERRVDDVLREFISNVNSRVSVALYNQVEACGQKRLDFVLHNLNNDLCCAVEVDGRSHFVEGGRKYSEEHLERVDILRRAGWRLVHVPYYEWYQGGWLCEMDSPPFRSYVQRLFTELMVALEIEPTSE